VITGDLDAALAAPVSSVGTWRPAPPGSGGAPGTYATTIAFLLARGSAKDPAGIAATLAARLRTLDWVSDATVTGGGYLTVTVTADALAWLAVRITQAGPGCARSDALAGTTLAAPATMDLASAATWEEARRRLTATVTGRLAEATGAKIRWTHNAERIAAPDSPAPDVAGSVVGRSAGSPAPGAAGSVVGESAAPTAPPALGGTGPAAGRPAGQRPVADAITFAGADAVIWALARLLPQGPTRVDARLAAAHDLGNPAYAVRYAHAHAASTLRQAADLGLGRGEAAEFQPRLLAHPSERALLYELSWLPERVAGAARRRRPDVLARFLEELARAYLDCQESCPAAWPGAVTDGTSPGAVTDGTSPGAVPGGTSRDVLAGVSPVTPQWEGSPGGGPAAWPATAPGEPAASQASGARLWLAEAARTALRAGLGLLGVDAPDRL
jgi:arginyl-tRNA synthetase